MFTPAYDENFLGEIYIDRGAMPYPITNVLRGSGKFLKFVDGKGFPVPLTHTDRKQSTAVIEDCSPEQFAVLRDALLENGWVNVVARP